jgi:FtsH-binding integral membrane protein
MSYDPTNSPSQTGYVAGQAIDAGLQSFMQGVYRTMGLGLIITGLAAVGLASSPALFELVFTTPLRWVVMLAPLGIIFFGFTPARLARMSSEKLKLTFYVFSILMGLSMGFIFAAYTGNSIARVFFSTAATFAGTSLYGYTTRRSLASAGSFLFMGLFGIIIASLVNLFMQSAMVHFVVSVIGVVVFTGLTAWETQNLKNVYREGAGEANDKQAVVGALSLYLNFINLFQIMLSFMGDRK